MTPAQAPGPGPNAAAFAQKSSLWSAAVAVAFAVSAISLLGGVGYWSRVRAQGITI